MGDHDWSARLADAYGGLADDLKRYWRAYGGTGHLVTSPYLHISFILMLLLFPAWQSPGWWDTVLFVMPSVLGFSLGGYAIWLAIGDPRFHAIIAGGSADGETSPYLDVSAAFAHFIVLQFAAIITALAASAHAVEDPGWFLLSLWALSYWLFLYALLLALATGLMVFQVATWYDEFMGDRPDDEG